MISNIEKTIERYNMIPPNSRLIAALSGGSDSMAMINALIMLREKYGFTLEAAHVNHGIRGETAQRDELFVKNWCDENDIPVHILHSDIPSIAEKSGEGLEECGRRIRYEFFSSLGDDAIIATAHTLSDRVETFLFNVTRGSALKGLCSIPAKRDNIIRPLYDCTKDQIEQFCKQNFIPHIEDETNFDITYSRNRIRHNVVTQLKQINPSVEQCIGRCTEMLREDEFFLSSLAEESVKKSYTNGGYLAAVIAECPAPVRSRTISLIVRKETDVVPEFSSVEQITELIIKKTGSCQINGGVTVRVRKGIIEFPKSGQICFEPAEFDFGGTKFGNKVIFGELIDFNETIYLQILSKSYSDFFVDYDKIIGKMIIRSRLSGDKITLKSRNCTKTLKKLYNELSIAPKKRDSLFVVADDNGVLVSEAAGCDKRCLVTKETKTILKISVKQDQKGC